MVESRLFTLFCIDVRKYKILSKEEELILLKDYKDTNNLRSRDILFNSNLRYLITIVNQYKGLEMDKMDMIQSGSLGLLEAIEKFNVDSGNKLLTFARPYIIGSIKRSFYNEEFAIKKTKYVRNKIKNDEMSDFNFISVSNDVLLEETLEGDCYDSLFDFDEKATKIKLEEFWFYIRKLLKKESYYDIVYNMFSADTSTGTVRKLTETEIGKIFSISKQAVGVKKHKIFNILRNDPQFIQWFKDGYLDST